jgi:hypothetical protein
MLSRDAVVPEGATHTAGGSLLMRLVAVTAKTSRRRPLEQEVAGITGRNSTYRPLKRRNGRKGKGKGNEGLARLARRMLSPYPTSMRMLGILMRSITLLHQVAQASHALGEFIRADGFSVKDAADYGGFSIA